MVKMWPALAGIVLMTAGAIAAPAPKTGRAPTPAIKARNAAKPAAKARAKAKPVAAAAEVPVEISPSADAQRVADWVASSGDNRALPYAIIDKHAASMVLYDAKGNPVGQVPVLIGIATGDDATPGVGSKTLAEIGPAEKTTPAGRFLARFGYAAGRQRVLWVDYTNSVAIHPIPADAVSAEQRKQRMLSPEAEDNRITFGCINVPRAFYGTSIRPLFQRKGGYVYVLPDTRPVEEVFPRLRVHALQYRAATS